METLALAALTAALSLPGARAELVALRPSVPAGCAATTVESPRAVSASGDVALRVTGARATAEPCTGWAWARVRVIARVPVAARALREGEALDPTAYAVAEREVVAGRTPVLGVPAGATAARGIAAGTTLEDVHLRIGPPPGAPVTVLLRVGALAVEQGGRSVPCTRGRACALLPTGRRVEGRFDGARLVVEAP